MKSPQQLINDRYQITRNIGADKSGYFLCLKDTENKKTYYTKLVKIEDQQLSAKTLYDIQMRMKRLTQFSHTNVISVYDPELAPEGLLLRQNDLPGTSLKNLMQKSGRPLPKRVSYSAALDIASALAALHSEGLVHGELDPSHIWIDESGKNYLSFLELPPAFDSDRAVYTMPDLTQSADRQTASDIFAFGVLMLEMCTGLSAYRSSGDETDIEEYSRVFTYYRGCISESVEKENPNLAPILTRCLSENKAQRFKDGEELYWAIRGMLEKEQPKKAQPEPIKPEEIQQTINVKQVNEIPEDEPPAEDDNDEMSAFFNDDDRSGRPMILPFLIFGLLLIGGGIYFLLNRPSIDLSSLFEVRHISSVEMTPQYQQTMSILHMTQTAMEESSVRKTAEVKPTATPEPTATATLPPTATLLPRPITAETGKLIRWNADGSLMAAVPASSFTMGMDHTFLFEPDGILPSHSVSLDTFWIDRAEITQAQYARCVGEGVCRPIERIAEEWIGDDLPIMNVRWSDAVSYCAWAGKRLPSEAEWEKAARGSDRRLYPWGNETLSIGTLPTGIHKGGEDPRDTSPYGALDMGGNVSEWVNDFFSETRLLPDEGELVNPIGPISGNTHTVKGGSFLSADPESSRFTFMRFGAQPDSSVNYGFRCVVSGTDVDDHKAAEEPEKAALARPVKTFDRPPDCTDRARFVNDITIPDGTPVKKGEWITKTWTLENYGTCPWSENYKVVWNDDDFDNPQKMFDIGVDLMPGQQGEISVTFQAKGDGLTRISFRLANTDGETFGLGPERRGDLYIEYRAE